jgi:hypothetical protein
LPAAADRQLCVLKRPRARPMARAASTICAASTPVHELAIVEVLAQ